LRNAIEGLNALFNARSIAFVGASNDPGKWGYVILSNLLNGGFTGKIYPVNPREKHILGLEAFPSIGELPETPELVIIVIPPSAVAQVIRDSAEKGIKAGVVITAGFAEVGTDGEQMQEEMAHLARQGGMVLVGPNCNGIMSPFNQLYCTMPPNYPDPGPFAVIGHSGNVASTVVRNLMSWGLGVSRYVSSGNEADLHMEDYLEFLEQDERTRVILMYMEGIRNGRKFLEVVRRVNRKKPVLALKAGVTPAGSMAARSHTAAVAGSDHVFNAMCRQAGIIRVQNMTDLVEAGGVFLNQPLPKSNRLAIVTGGGGAGVLAADVCAQTGLELSPLSEETLGKLDQVLPPWWPRSNPVDMVAGIKGDILGILETLLEAPEVDGLIVLGMAGSILRLAAEAGSALGWREITEASRNVFYNGAARVMALKERYKKPVLVAMTMPLVGVHEAAAQLKDLTRETQTLFYTSPHRAAYAYSLLVQYASVLKKGNGLRGEARSEFSAA